MGEPFPISLEKGERDQYSTWLSNAFAASQNYDGSERSEDALIAPLKLIEDFIRAKTGEILPDSLEATFARAACPDLPDGIPFTINTMLQATADRYYGMLQNARGFETLLELMAKGGAVVRYHQGPFIPPDKIKDDKKTAAGGDEQREQLKTFARLAHLVRHLKDEGIYTDDMIFDVSYPDPDQRRSLPYIIMQIPRLKKEISVCDEVGEKTFVGHKILGFKVWKNLKKSRLKERHDITPVRFTNEAAWWNKIKGLLFDPAVEPDARNGKKVNIRIFARKRAPLDIDLIKQCILAYHKARPAQGREARQWPAISSGPVTEGPYAGEETWASLTAAVSQGLRGLSGGITMSELCRLVARENGLEYYNRMNQDDFDIEKIKESILAHRLATGTWPQDKMGEIEYGPYKNKAAWRDISNALNRGTRGLAAYKGVHLSDLNAQVSKEHKLDYINHSKKPNLTIEKIKKSILLHRQKTGQWPTQYSGPVLYGPYKNKETWQNIDAALLSGARGLPTNFTLAELKQQVSDEHGLDYVRRQGSVRKAAPDIDPDFSPE